MSEPVGIVAVGERLHSELPLRTKHDVIATLGQLALPHDEYFLVGGANLVLRDVKLQTRDIDALVSDQLFNDLVSREGIIVKQPPVMARRLGADNTTVWIEADDLPIPFTATTSMGDGYFPQSFEQYRSQVEDIEGFPCVSLEVVRASKLALQRPYPASDLPDLNAIARHLGEPDSEPLPAPTIVHGPILS